MKFKANDVLNAENLFAKIAGPAVPQLADLLIMTVRTPDGLIWRFAASEHQRPATGDRVRGFMERNDRHRSDLSVGAREILRSGKAHLFQRVSAEALLPFAHDVEDLSFFTSVDVRSLIVVPFADNGNGSGIAMFFRLEPHDGHASEDVLRAEAVVRSVTNDVYESNRSPFSVLRSPEKDPKNGERTTENGQRRTDKTTHELIYDP